jgi:hypothetical protein
LSRSRAASQRLLRQRPKALGVELSQIVIAEVHR